MRVKQLDIAKVANVSQATVSRVLAGDSRVEPQIRDRVKAAIQQMNYRPDVRAQALRTKKTGLLGLVLKRPKGALHDDPFFSALISAIMDQLVGKPYHLCLDFVTDEKGQQGIYDEMLRSRRVDGLVLVESEANDVRIARLYEDHFPFVLIGNADNVGIPQVDNDNKYAGELATRHLLDQGFRKIGFLAGPSGITVSDDRVDGYRHALRAASVEPIVWHSDFGLYAAQKTAKAIYESDARPDALVVLDDFMAFGAILSARSRGLVVPRDLGIVSFNNSSLCSLLDGGLTSVDMNIPQLVDRAVTRLLHIIENGNGNSVSREIVPCELHVRGSSQGCRA